MRLRLEVAITPRWHHVERVRAGVVKCLEAACGDEGAWETVAMVAGELLENAIKYADWARGSSLHVHVEGDDAELAIEVGAPRPSDEAIARLDEALATIAVAPSPRDAYLDRMRVVSGSTRPGGMGLVRIAYEGRATLARRIDGDRLIVSAALDARKPPMSHP